MHMLHSLSPKLGQITSLKAKLICINFSAKFRGLHSEMIEANYRTKFKTPNMQCRIFGV